MKFLVLNKNDADLKYRIDHINSILDKNKPHFMTLTELQKHKSDTLTQYQFPGYVLEYDDLDKTDGWSRTGVLIRKNIKYKRRRDLETKGTSTVLVTSWFPWFQTIFIPVSISPIPAPWNKWLKKPPKPSFQMEIHN